MSYQKSEVIEVIDPTQLEIAKSILRTNQVDYEVRNEVSLYAGSASILGGHGATIWVNQDDLGLARTLLIDSKVLVPGKDTEFGAIIWIQKNLNFGPLKGTSFLVKMLYLFLVISIVSISYGIILVNR